MGIVETKIIHDINNLLCVIAGQSELIIEDPDRLEGVNKRAEKIEKATRKLSKLIKENDFLNLLELKKTIELLNDSCKIIQNLKN